MALVWIADKSLTISALILLIIWLFNFAIYVAVSALIFPPYIRITKVNGGIEFEFKSLDYAITFKNVNRNKLATTTLPLTRLTSR